MALMEAQGVCTTRVSGKSESRDHGRLGFLVDRALGRVWCIGCFWGAPSKEKPQGGAHLSFRGFGNERVWHTLNSSG